MFNTDVYKRSHGQMPDKSSLELPAHYVPVIKLKNDKLHDCLGIMIMMVYSEFEEKFICGNKSLSPKHSCNKCLIGLPLPETNINNKYVIYLPFDFHKVHRYHCCQNLVALVLFQFEPHSWLVGFSLLTVGFKK